MECREFRARVEEALSGAGGADLRRHAAECYDCRRLYEGAKLVGRTLSATPAEIPGPALDREWIGDLWRVRRPGLSVVLRVAAAVLLLASGGIAALLGLSPGRARESLALRVVVETAVEGDPEDLAIEEMYGPRGSGNHTVDGENGATLR
jgi:hypothetical protein